MRVHLASSFTNDRQEIVLSELIAAGYDAYIPSMAYLDYVDATKADACVWLVPCGSSADFEAGWMIGRGKPTCVLRAMADLRVVDSASYSCERFGDQAKTIPRFSVVAEVIAWLESVRQKTTLGSDDV
jgi:hypothetical protein